MKFIGTITLETGTHAIRLTPRGHRDHDDQVMTIPERVAYLRRLHGNDDPDAGLIEALHEALSMAAAGRMHTKEDVDGVQNAHTFLSEIMGGLSDELLAMRASRDHWKCLALNAEAELDEMNQRDRHTGSGYRTQAECKAYLHAEDLKLRELNRITYGWGEKK